jgi:oxygen-independent coproporphyrinogen-3 oxidase
MNLKEKEKLFRYVAQKYDSMDYPPNRIWGKIRKEAIRDAWKERVKEIASGAVDFPGLYIHVPYCQTKCFFCKFKTRVANSEKILQEYLKCLEADIDYFSPIFKKVEFKTVYLAGGTPTIFSVKQLDRIFKYLTQKFNLAHTLQRQIEATPATLNFDKLKILKKYNFNRLTIGVQSLDDKVLALMNRRNQNYALVRNIYDQARKIGIEIINLDLVVGLPKQSINSFVKDLRRILSLRPDAIHIYPYEEEDQVIFYRMGKLMACSDRERRDKMVELADNGIKKAGYEPYRNEPYLLSPKAANFQFQFRYLFNGSLLGLGAGALSYIPGQYSYQNHGLDEYLCNCIEENNERYFLGVALDNSETRINYVINNIRAGVDKARFLSIFKIDFSVLFRKELDSLRKIGRLSEDGNKVKLIANNDFEFRAYSKFFYSNKVINELKRRISLEYISNERKN